MKSFIVALILFCIILACIICNGIYIKSTCNEISELCQLLWQSSDRESTSLKIKALWQKCKTQLELSIRTNEIERMTDLIESLHSSVIIKNETEIQKYCTLISEHAEDMARHESISLLSIF